MSAKTLCTCFEPFGPWQHNVSQLVAERLGKQLRQDLRFRTYPVDFAAARAVLLNDLAETCTYIVHLGQAADCEEIQLEALAVNLAGDVSESHRQFRRIATDGPAAYATTMPISRWLTLLQQSGIPARISHHAGSYLCNAVYYLSNHYAHLRQLPTRVAFMHLPVDLPIEVSARAVELVLDDLDRESLPNERVLKGLHASASPVSTRPG